MLKKSSFATGSKTERNKAKFAGIFMLNKGKCVNICSVPIIVQTGRKILSCSKMALINPKIKIAINTILKNSAHPVSLSASAGLIWRTILVYKVIPGLTSSPL